MAHAPFKVIITDNDHGFITQEETVFAGAEFELTLLQLRDEQDVIDACGEADGLVIQYAPLTAKVIPHLKKCQMLSRYGVGYDTIDVAAATAAGILVANVPDYGVEEVSMHAMSLLLQFYRKTAICDHSIRNGEWEYLVAEPIHKAARTVLGVFGVGRIGAALAAKAVALGFDVIGCDKDPSKIPANVRAVDFATLLRESDLISVHTDLNESTRHIFNDAAFAAMKKGSVIVNTARGAIVEEAALVRALKSGHLAAAGLDVLEHEPPRPSDDGGELITLPNVVLTPHIAWYSTDSRLTLKHRTADNVRMTLCGELSPYVVNPDVLRSPLLRFRQK